MEEAGGLVDSWGGGEFCYLFPKMCSAIRPSGHLADGPRRGTSVGVETHSLAADGEAAPLPMSGQGRKRFPAAARVGLPAFLRCLSKCRTN